MSEIEDVESFRLRAKEWIAANLPRLPERDGADGLPYRDLDEAAWLRQRELQRLLYDGGFAGICFPREYGGLGLTPEHQKAFTAETAGYEMPLMLNIPTFSICAPVILEMGSEELKRAHLPAVLRGDETLVQFLSEPRGGSDLAGVTTRATRDGDVFIVNGAKIWSSGAYAADYATCLVRTDWEAPKHRGLTMLLMKVHQPGVTIRQIKQLDGNEEFCEEFFDDVEVPVGNVIGEVNGGWTVASRQLFHERNAVGGGSPYVSGGAVRTGRAAPVSELTQLVRRTGQDTDPRARELVAESHLLSLVQQQLIDRVVAGMTAQQLPPTAGSIIRLFGGMSAVRRAEITLELGGASAATDPAVGVQFLMRQASCLGGGSTEMARNIISERVLGMPREYAADRDIPFSQVRQGRLGAIMATGKLFHIIHLTGDLPALEAWYDDVFGVRRGFLDNNYMPGEKRDASLVVLGDCVIEPLAPAFRVDGWDLMPLGRFYKRFGTHWHSIAWYTDDAGDIWQRCTDNGIRCYIEGGVVADKRPPANMAVMTHPKDTVTQLEFFNPAGSGILDRDPRFQADWDPNWWVTNHPLGLRRLAYTTVLTRDLDRAKHVYTDVLGGTLLFENASDLTGTSNSYVLIGDSSIVELATPNSDGTIAAADQAANGEIHHAATFNVVDLDRAEKYFTSKGIKVLERDDSTLVTDPATTQGVPFRWTTWSVPGDPRS